MPVKIYVSFVRLVIQIPEGVKVWKQPLFTVTIHNEYGLDWLIVAVLRGTFLWSGWMNFFLFPALRVPLGFPH